MACEQISSRATRTICSLALLTSAAVAIAVLASRNLYDDEILSLPIITSAPGSIVHFAAVADVHPPGMYLLGHLALRVVPSFRWMNLIPTAVLYAGLAAFVFSFAPLFRRPWPLTIFLLLAAFHPEVFVWGTSYRWYSWWTGIALLTLILAIRSPRSNPSLSTRRAVCVGVLLAALLYINYITLLFAPALIVAMFVRDKHLKGMHNIRETVIAGAVFLGMSAYQLRTLIAAQIERGGQQRTSQLSSFVHLAYATLASEAYLPWHPLALISAAAMLAVLASAALRKRKTNDGAAASSARALTAFAIAFFVLVATSGLGGRPRNALLLIPLFAFVFATAAAALPVRLQQTVTVVMAVWSALGIGHILGRTGLMKATMNDRPEQVVSFVRQRSCAVVVTYDPLLAFSLSHPTMPGTLVLSRYAAPIAASSPVPAKCSAPMLYIVRSYLGAADNKWAERMDTELDGAAGVISGPREMASFSLDPDAARKRTWSRLGSSHKEIDAAAGMPDYRYTVVSGRIAVSAIPELRTRLPDFCTADQCAGPVQLSFLPDR